MDLGAIIERYNACRPGERFDALVDAYRPGLLVGLLEAGARHSASPQPDGSWRLEIERRGWGASHTAFTADGAAWIGCSVSDHLARVDLSTKARTGIVALTPN